MSNRNRKEKKPAVDLTNMTREEIMGLDIESEEILNALGLPIEPDTKGLSAEEALEVYGKYTRLISIIDAVSYSLRIKSTAKFLSLKESSQIAETENSTESEKESEEEPPAKKKAPIKRKTKKPESSEEESEEAPPPKKKQPIKRKSKKPISSEEEESEEAPSIKGKRR